MRAIHHIAVICSDYARSRAFYRDILQLPVIREVWRAERQSWKCDLDAGNAQIELFSFPNPPARTSRPEACGLRHLAFTVANIDAEVARLDAAGVACEPIRIDEYTGQRFTFFTDPDGLPLELYEQPAP
ncbi:MULTISPECIES: VOC family protein [unclassified Sphingobium]|uniref:SMU1112c/YaeR family gloxylase I-like metalloprotein n=1 Tax=unclassified Sphingobium TaxID=2611147 RepID=UPI000D163080|nr:MULTISPECIES: VOC family protein [unclassified Sphingobium]MBG6117210.1 glyoxylase I family protein [Sphingobium sp. JAI105]PSO11255.1 VOC family protein [Sphingobium sp. AEW4]TWD12584.1 glyoxylase I family protein [Sphingobium sp. AEW010]TWD30355.1 glyoxylase I family protein [Sphingobium sp. AEW013]TWD30890.1 glyoxylase I family protein [Sphingobium sp. AEW001]